MDLTPFRHRAVRDLAWACFSRPLVLSDQLGATGPPLANTVFELNPARRSWLAGLDRAPDNLHLFLEAAPGRRLGLYFERLWQFFLQHDPAVELLAHNLPVRDGGRTVGEFDCLYYCRARERHCHLELAVKYYLGHGSPPDSPSPWRYWLGPGSHDRLDLKLERLIGHQARLADHPLGRKTLEEHGIEAPLREVEIKGYLFRHPAAGIAPPRAFNPQRRLAPWWRAGELPGALDSVDSALRYTVLPRLHWLAPATGATDTLDRNQLAEHLRERFCEHPGSQLVAGVDARGVERTRFFITPDHWPG